MTIAEAGWASQSAFPILSGLIATPLLGSVAALMTRTARQAAIAGLVWAGLEMALVIFLLLRFDIRFERPSIRRTRTDFLVLSPTTWASMASVCCL